MFEIWKPVVGFEGQYEVSNLGCVRSLSRTVEYMREGKLVVARHKGRILVASPNTNGYPQVYLPKIRNRCVHLLVLEAFVGLKPEGTEALHEDGNPSNPALSNLEWGSHTKNMREMLQHGRSTKAKLTPEQASVILNSDRPKDELAADFSVHVRTIRRIKARTIWRHVV